MTLATLRPKPTLVQHILSQYHTAYLDLQAALLGVSDAELDLLEEMQFPIRHRLHRYEAHIAQHTVQIDKTFIVDWAGSH
jgi:hypothetical protein